VRYSTRARVRSRPPRAPHFVRADRYALIKRTSAPARSRFIHSSDFAPCLSFHGIVTPLTISLTRCQHCVTFFCRAIATTWVRIAVVTLGQRGHSVGLSIGRPSVDRARPSFDSSSSIAFDGRRSRARARGRHAWNSRSNERTRCRVSERRDVT